MAQNGKRKKSGPIQRAFVKGLSIILPAVITIAIFAWVWDILRVYVVELTIKAIDQVELFEPRVISPEELRYVDARYFDNPAEALVSPEYRTTEHLHRLPRVGDLPTEYRGMTPPGQRRSVLQFILDTNALENVQSHMWKRDYDDSGRVISYNWFDYLLAAVLGLSLVVLLGFLARNFLGRRMVTLLEWFVTRVPVVKSIYPHAKQLVEFFFTDNKPIEFDTVGVIEYPRRGLWSIAFVTGAGLKSVQEATGKRMVTVYVPSSPAPMTGYCMIMPAEEVIQVDVTVEEAMKFVISGGVLAPREEMVKPASGAQYALSHTINEQIRKRQTTMLRKADALKAIEKDVTGAEESVPNPDEAAAPEVETREVKAPDADKPES
ncbi:MAG: DUF502 domain-containing protein [Planctomycetes bacterium]|nr:DUF502 domain-containing protein [Planctomycetota bacterium]